MLEGLEISEIFFSSLHKPARMEAEYYQKKYLSLENALKGKKPVLLSTLTQKVSDGTHFTPNYTESGVPFLSALNVLENSLSFEAGHRFISQEDHDLLYRRCDPKAGDVLLRKVGVGPRWAAVVPGGLPVFSIFVSVALLRPRIDIIASEVLATFINSESGQTQLLRVQKGASQPDLHLEDIKDVFIPQFDQNFQNEIIEIHQRSVRISSQGASSYKQAESLLLHTLGLADFSPSTGNSNIKLFQESFGVSGRLDAEYYQPKFDELEAKMAEKHELVSLKNVLTLNQRGTQPDYAEEGLPVINSKHVREGEVVLSDNRIANVPDKEEPLLIQNGDVLINGTGVGTIGRSAPYLHEQKAIPDNHVTILRTDKLNPIFLSVYLNSIAGKYQVDKYFKGSSGQIELYPKDIDCFYVPLVDEAIQANIAELVKQSFTLKNESKRLLEVAKRAVEIAIKQNEQAALDFIARESNHSF